MGIAQTLAPDQINLVQIKKIIFNEPKMPLEKFIIFRTPAINGAHFYRPLCIFELNHKVFEFGHLNLTNILFAQIILIMVEGY